MADDEAKVIDSTTIPENVGTLESALEVCNVLQKPVKQYGSFTIGQPCARCNTDNLDDVVSKAQIISPQLTYDDIDCLYDNPLGARRTAKARGIDLTGVKDVVQILQRLKLDITREIYRDRGGDNFVSIVETAKRCDEYRTSCLQISVDKLLILAGKIAEHKNWADADPLQDLLEAKLPKYCSYLEKIQANLHENCLPVLVTGETSAGKSMFINVLLNETILPTSFSSNTSSICEIKYGPKREAHTIAKDGTRTLIAETPSFEENLRQVLEKRNDRAIGSTYAKVELCIPNELLKQGLCIVDSPGFGENEAFNELLGEYYDKAFAYIYIIRTSNSGGIQEDRLEKAVLELRQKQYICDDGLFGFRSDSAVFVLNRWDEIRDDKKGRFLTLKHNIASIWTGISDTQIIRLSSTDASFLQKYNITALDLKEVLQQIQHLLLSTLLNRSAMSYSKAMRFVTITIQSINSQLRAFSLTEDNVRHRQEKYSVKIKKMEERLEIRVKMLRKLLKTKIGEGCEHMIAYLKTTEAKNAIVNQMINEACPEGHNWDTILPQIQWLAAQKTVYVLNRYEEEIPFFTNVCDALLTDFRAAFVNLEDYIANDANLMDWSHDDKDINDFVLNHGNEADQMRRKGTTFNISSFPRTARLVFGIAFPVVLPLSLVAASVALPIVLCMSLKNRLNKMEREIKYKRYATSDENKRGIIAEETLKMVNNYATSGKEIKRFAKTKIGHAYELLDRLTAAVQQQIKACHIELRQLAEQRYNSGKLKIHYDTLREEFLRIQRELLLFCHNHMVGADDIDANSLVLSSNQPTKVPCSGLNLAVIKVTDASHGSFGAVRSVKVITQRLYNWNIEELIRGCQLNHTNMCRVLGFVKHMPPLQSQQMMHIENIDCNLAYYIAKNLSNIVEEKTKLDILQDIFRQVDSGLAYLHSHKTPMVAFDLSLNSLGVSVGKTPSDSVIKLINVVSPGSVEHYKFHSRRISDICHLPRSILVDKTTAYDTMCDRYCFATAMYEAWWSRKPFYTVFNDNADISLEAFLSESADVDLVPTECQNISGEASLWNSLVRAMAKNQTITFQEIIMFAE